jgi:transcriptional regulator with XRE-family HTH domain
MSIATIRRRQRRARHGLGGRDVTVLSRRTDAPLARGVSVPYAVGVATPTLPIDRKAWAAVIKAFIQEESGGNITAFAEIVGVDRKTVTRWLAQEVSVSPESVHAVAGVLDKDVATLMTTIGYQPAATPTRAPTPPQPREDAAIAEIRAADLPPSIKRDLIRHFADRARQDEEQRVAEARQQIAILRRARRRAG